MGIYSMEQWERDQVFKAAPGQQIDGAIYERMLNCTPPRDLSREALENTDTPVHAGFLMGEPHDHDQTGARFLAFGMNDYGKGPKYFYLGLAHDDRLLNGTYYCFDSIGEDIDPLQPAGAFQSDRDAIQAAMNYESKLFKVTYKAGKVTASERLYTPQFL